MSTVIWWDARKDASYKWSRDHEGMDTGATALKEGFGRRLKAARQAAGFSKARSLARLMGIEENTLTKWERGGSLPSPVNLRKLRDALSVTLDYLFLGDMRGLPADVQQRLHEVTSDGASDGKSDVA